MATDIQEERYREYTNPSREVIEDWKDKYSINMFKYPSNLFSDEVLHHVEFSINVRGKSKYNKENRKFQIDPFVGAAGMTEEELAQASIVTATASAGILATTLTTKIAGAYGKTGGLAKLASLAPGAMTGLAVADGISSHKILKPDVKYRISDVIALYMDGPPIVKYHMNYSSKELGTLAGILSGSAFNSIQSSKSAASEVGAALGTSLAKLPQMFGATDIQSLMSASSKTQLNPFKEVIFESVDFRSFAFKYKFLPKNKQEAINVKKIVELFKFHMHPELSTGKLFFIYPSEFNITYYFKNRENLYFHKIAPCVLESCAVNYGSEQYSTFHDGTPVEVNLELTFTETEILSKDMIQRGY